MILSLMVGAVLLNRVANLAIERDFCKLAFAVPSAFGSIRPSSPRWASPYGNWAAEFEYSAWTQRALGALVCRRLLCSHGPRYHFQPVVRYRLCCIFNGCFASSAALGLSIACVREVLRLGLSRPYCCLCYFYRIRRAFKKGYCAIRHFGYWACVVLAYFIAHLPLLAGRRPTRQSSGSARKAAHVAHFYFRYYGNFKHY